MSVISQKRCFNHPEREAAARCLECNRDFCRECVTDHNHRLICTNCLHNLTGTKKRRIPFSKQGLIYILAIVSFLVLWVLWMGYGEYLLTTTENTHETFFQSQIE